MRVVLVCTIFKYSFNKFDLNELTVCSFFYNFINHKSIKKHVSMIRKYHNHTLQTTPRHREEEPKYTDCHTTLERQLK